MRYIYYLVAALIFLAVVNLSARWLGDDSGTTEAPASQAATTAAATEEQASADSEGAAVEQQQSAPLAATSDDQPPKVQAPTSAANVEPEEQLAPPETATEPVGLTAAQPINEAQGTTENTTADANAATAAESADPTVAQHKAAMPVDESVGQLAATVTTKESVPTPDPAVANDSEAATSAPAAESTPTATLAPATADTAEPVAEAAAVIGAAIAQSKQTQADDQVANQTDPSALVETALVDGSADALPPTTAGAADENSAAPVAAEPPAENLVDSIVSTASNAAEVVVEGAQTAVDSVVDAATSLLDSGEPTTAAASQTANAEAPKVDSATTDSAAATAPLDTPTPTADPQPANRLANEPAAAAPKQAPDTTILDPAVAAVAPVVTERETPAVSQHQPSTEETVRSSSTSVILPPSTVSKPQRSDRVPGAGGRARVA